MDVVKYIQTKTNFTFSILDENDGSWGTRDENGSWNGLVRDIMDGGADVRLVELFCISFHRVTPRLSNTIDDYSEKYGMRGLVKKPVTAVPVVPSS